MMKLLSLAVAFAALSFTPLTTFGQPDDETPRQELTDAQIWPLLGSVERGQWQAALQEIERGNTQIQRGEFLLSKRLSAFDNPDLARRELEEDHREGRKAVNEGKARIAEAEKVIEELRQLGAQRYYERLAAQQPLVQEFAVELDRRGGWSKLVETFYEELEDRGVQQLYFAGLFDDYGDVVVRVPANEVADALAEEDRNDGRMRSVAADSIFLTANGNALSLDFRGAETAREVPGSAVVIARRVPLSAFVDLLVLDALSLQSLALQQRSLAVVRSTYAPEDEEVPPMRLVAGLEDQRRFIEKVGEAPAGQFNFRADVSPFDSSWRAATLALFEVTLLNEDVTVLPVAMLKRLYDVTEATGMANAEFRLVDEAAADDPAAATPTQSPGSADGAVDVVAESPEGADAAPEAETGTDEMAASDEASESDSADEAMSADEAAAGDGDADSAGMAEAENEADRQTEGADANAADGEMAATEEGDASEGADATETAASDDGEPMAEANGPPLETLRQQGRMPRVLSRDNVYRVEAQQRQGTEAQGPVAEVGTFRIQLEINRAR
ncbi:MAG: hypothetical protein ACFB21_10645 [Opitutales bacterium]